MCRVNFSVLLLAACLSVLPASKAEDVKVLFVADSTSHTLGGTQMQTEMLNDLEDAFDASGLGHRNFVAATSQLWTTLCMGGTNVTHLSLLSCLEADTALARDALAADVVVMIAWTIKDASPQNSVCGAAQGVKQFPSYTFSSNNDDRAFIVINRSCWLNYPLVTAHEMGHVLYLEHEIAPGDDDLFESIPVSNNHGYKSPSNRKTLMAANLGGSFELFSDQFANFPGTSEKRGKVGEAHAKGVIDGLAWDPVSHYRDPLPPPVATCSPDYIAGQEVFSWGVQNQTIFDVLTGRRSTSGGGWVSVDVSNPTAEGCIPATCDSTYEITVSNIFGIDICTTFVACQGGGGWTWRPVVDSTIGVANPIVLPVSPLVPIISP